MFSRRRGSSASRSRPLDSSTSANATAAASQAFLRKSESNASLSSAAAAAALRSLTSSPEPVGNLVTKRMARRGSVSSVGSGSVAGSARGGPVRPGLQRQNSSGSMTERTFRSPSPGRNNAPMPASNNAPPVPRLPPGHQRSSSMEPPQRVLSPTPAGRGGRNMSVDRAPRPPPLSTGSGKRLSNVHEEQLQRTDSNQSVNFSRPRSSQPSSPVSPVTASAHSFTHGTGSWFTEPAGTAAAPSTSRSSAIEPKVARIQAAAQQAMGHTATAARPAAQRQPSYEGPPSMSYEADDSVVVYDPNTRTFVNVPRATPKRPQPPSPKLPPAPALAPGTYDPNTRTIVPASPSSLKQASPVTTPKSEKTRLDIPLQPPPRNPARVSPTNSPVTAARPLLPTYPSTVREDPAAEERAETQASSAAATQPTSATQLTAGTAPLPATSATASTSNAAARGRNLSSSPSPHRAHFSRTPVFDAHKHSPPGRDISPAKSALKHSPSSSIRANSPLIFSSASPAAVKAPPSEVSDASDLGSQDGLGVKKRRSVRVSFEDQPIEIEPANTAISRARSPLQNHDDDDEDDDEIMAPRPALPSFGSVRRDRGGVEVAEKVTETPRARQTPAPASSSDHAIGGILKAASDSLPPEVTSKESAAGYVSDESDEGPSAINQNGSALPAVAAAMNSPEQHGDHAHTKEPTAALEAEDGELVPAITLLPPTPGTDDENKGLHHAAEGDYVAPEQPPADISAAANPADTADTTDAIDNIDVDDGDDGLSSYITPQLLEAIDEDSDSSGEFSDAAEDLSELDNGGFASLNAIAASPIAAASSKPKPSPTSPPESPTMNRHVRKASLDAKAEDSDQRSTGGDWSEATSYWSKLSKQQKDQIEQQHIVSDDDAQPASPVTAQQKRVSQAPAVAAESIVLPAVAAVSARSTTLNQTATPVSRQQPTQAQPIKSAMKKSLREQPQAAPENGEVQMRKSMRNGGAMATTMRSGQAQQRPRSAIVETQNQAQQKPARPMSSAAAATSANRTVLSKQRPPQSSSLAQTEPRKAAAAQAAAAPAVSRRLQQELAKADDSDSDSSFKKQRRARASSDAGGRFNMRRSMRAGPPDSGPVPDSRPISPPTVRGKRALSIRSLSPTGSFLGRNRGDKLRESLRANNESATRMTLRGAGAKDGGSKSRFGSSARTSANQGNAASRFRSRFADSDDEDDGTPSRGFFRSRFADSDDEDDGRFIAADLTPVRGIPRAKGRDDGDSTDLDDSDDSGAKGRKNKRDKKPKLIIPDPADVERAMEAARKKLGMAPQATSAAPAAVADPTAPQPAEQPAAATSTTATTTKQGSALTQGSLRTRANSDRPDTQLLPTDEFAQDSVQGDTPTKRRSFMGSILRRNRASTASVPTINYGRTSAIPPASIPGNVASSPTDATQTRASTLPLHSSAAPRLTRGDSNYSNATAPPLMGEQSEHWPLPPPVPAIPERTLRNGGTGFSAARPNTSDGSPSKGRRAGSVRFDESADDHANNKEIYSHRTGKKKKFGMIRRAFKLND